MNNDWLKQLAPAHAPPPAAWWPPAPGWWGLAALVVVVALAAFFWYRRPLRRLQRAALTELKMLQSGVHDDAGLAHHLERLMRRYALAAYGRDDVASLSGEAWLAFVASHGGTNLAGEPGQNLMRAAFGGRADTMQSDRSRWLAGARDFIRSRR
jgi:hypothetical protein